jgi:replication factor C large subunit
MLTILKQIAKKQNLEVADGVLDDIIDNSSGDLRAAISDFELVVKSGLGDVDISSRDIRRSIEDTLKRLFMASDMDTARRILSDVDIDHDQFILWLEENVPLHLLTPHELELGYEVLSQADLYLGRIWRGPNWRLLAYFYDILAAGLPSSRQCTPFRQVKYSQSTWPLLVWRGNMTRQKNGELLSRLAREAGVSKARVSRTHQDTIQQIIDRNPSRGGLFADWLSLKRGTFDRSKSRRSG